MKIFLAAEDRTMGIKLANSINKSGSTCILGDEETSDRDTLLQEVKEEYSAYDMSILVSGEPLEATMEANKVGGLRAAACKDVSGIADAMEAKCNLLILDANRLRGINTQDMLKTMDDYLSGKKKKPAAQETLVKSESKSQGSGMMGSLKGAFGMGEQTVQEKPKERAKVQEKAKPKDEEYKPRRKGKGGFFNSLKDTFGVD